MDYKKLISDSLKSDIANAPEVKRVAVQELLWPGMQEHVCFCDGGQVYSALYQGETKMGPFVMVPQKENK